MAATKENAEALTAFQYFVRCNICYDAYKEPRTLPCLHTFCTTCLQRHVDVAMATAILGVVHFMCPTCRELVSLPRDGVAGFRRDFRVEQVREILDNFHAGANKSSHESGEDASGNESGVKCDICSAGELVYAVHVAETFVYCPTCHKWLCGACKTQHDNVDAFSSHMRPDPAERSHPDVGGAAKRCDEHDADPLAYVCRDCQCDVCAVCVMRTHVRHDVVRMGEALEDVMDRLSFQYKALITRRGQLNAMVTTTGAAQKELRIFRSLITKKIKSRVDEVIADIYKQENRLLAELHERCDSELQRLSRQKSEADDILTNMAKAAECAGPKLTGDVWAELRAEYDASASDIADLIEGSLLLTPQISRMSIDFVTEKTQNRLGKLSFSVSATRNTKSRAKRSSQREDVRDDTSDSFDEIDVASGGVWKPEGSLTLKLGKLGSSGGEFDMPRDACFLPWGDFAIADTTNERLQIFNSKGLLVNVIGQGRVKPWGVTCTKEGHLAVTDNLEKNIKIYDPLSGALLKQFGSFLSPCGICVNSKGHLLVTDFFSTCVYELNKDGGLKRQFRYRTSLDKHSCGAARVEVSPNDDVIISDVSNACLKAFDKRGRYLWSMPSVLEMLSPQGLAVTQDGITLVADAVNHVIAMYNLTGVYLGPLKLTGSRLGDPTAISISHDQRHLVATRLKAHQVRVYRISIPLLSNVSTSASMSSSDGVENFNVASDGTE